MGFDHQEINRLLQQLRANPYRYHVVTTPHTGYLRRFLVKEGDMVHGPSGKWLERPGTGLFVLERERNEKIIRAHTTGEIYKVHQRYEGQFVEAYQPVLEIRHALTQEEIIAELLQKSLHIVKAPEKARYLLAPQLAKKIEKEGEGKVIVRSGEEMVIMSFMKRETPILHEGPPMVVFRVFFSHQKMVEQGAPLLGLCSERELPYIQKLISRIKEEWPE